MYDTAQKYGSTRQQSFYQQDLVLEPEVFQRDHSYVVQKYLKAPALWLGHKFDFRIYVLITSVVDPMTIYLYNDGLVRLASEKYQGCSNHHDAFVHLTNYSLNKKNNNFDDVNHKLRLKDCLQGTLTQPPSKRGKEGATRQAADIWAEIESIVVKTVLTVQPQLQHIYRSCQPKEPDCCFELLGFDIMLDAKLKPWLIEVNHTPSFQTDTSIDETVKVSLLKDTLDII
jgi:tubulin polyglutamylase TTLL6/13